MDSQPSGPGFARRPGPGLPSLQGDVGVGQDLGEAPVHHLDLAEAADHHVRRLQVTVEDAPGVGIRDRLANLLEDPQEPRQVLRRIGPLLQECIEGPPPDQLHGEVHDGVVGGVPSSRRRTALAPGVVPAVRTSTVNLRIRARR